jgi:hypothetical protein
MSAFARSRRSFVASTPSRWSATYASRERPQHSAPGGGAFGHERQCCVRFGDRVVPVAGIEMRIGKGVRVQGEVPRAPELLTEAPARSKDMARLLQAIRHHEGPTEIEGWMYPFRLLGLQLGTGDRLECVVSLGYRLVEIAALHRDARQRAHPQAHRDIVTRATALGDGAASRPLGFIDVAGVEAPLRDVREEASTASRGQPLLPCRQLGVLQRIGQPPENGACRTEDPAQQADRRRIARQHERVVCTSEGLGRLACQSEAHGELRADLGGHRIRRVTEL